MVDLRLRGACFQSEVDPSRTLQVSEQTSLPERDVEAMTTLVASELDETKKPSTLMLSSTDFDENAESETTEGEPSEWLVAALIALAFGLVMLPSPVAGILIGLAPFIFSLGQLKKLSRMEEPKKKKSQGKKFGYILLMLASVLVSIGLTSFLAFLAVVDAVEVPVTLKIRTGWDRQNRNATEIARIAEDAGIQALAIHGRTKACRFVGEVEYESIAQVVKSISIPVIANGDINSPQQANEVLTKTGANAVMIGRGAQGNPWIFNQINHYLEQGELLPQPSLDEVHRVMTRHLTDLHNFYGEVGAVRISRKHMGWYSRWLPEGKAFTKQFNQLDSRIEQLQLLQQFFSQCTPREQAA